MFKADGSVSSYRLMFVEGFGTILRSPLHFAYIYLLDCLTLMFYGRVFCTI